MIRLGAIDEQAVVSILRNVRDDDRQQYEALSGLEWDVNDIADNILHAPRVGTKWVAYDGDHAFLMGGYDHVVNQVYQSWMLGSMDDWTKYWRSMTKIARKVMDAMFDIGARRLQTHVLPTRTETCVWYVRALKMQLEGELRGYGYNGETMAIYARVKE